MFSASFHKKLIFLCPLGFRISPIHTSLRMIILIKTEKALVIMIVITVMTRIEDIYDDIDNLEVLGTIPQEERQALPSLESRAGEQPSVKIFQPSVKIF